MAAQRVNLVSLLLGLISSLIACVQVNFAMLTVHLNYVKERANIFKLLSLSDGRIGRQRQLKRLGRQPRPVPDKTPSRQDSQSIFSIALEVLYSIVTLSSNSTSSSVQTKESAAFLSVFFGFCFDFDILKLIFKWKSTKRINKADFPPHRALYGACSEDILLQRDPGH